MHKNVWRDRKVLMEGSECSTLFEVWCYLRRLNCNLKTVVVLCGVRCGATYRKVAGSIPGGLMVDTDTNGNEYQEYFLGVRVADA